MVSSRAYYDASLEDFLSDSIESILGQLTLHHAHALEDLQKRSWISQVEILKRELASFSSGRVFFEFSIPRMGKRADVILVLGGIVFVIEFKVGAGQYQSHDREQAVDYALDLKHFHEGSHHAVVVPMLVSTKAPDFSNFIEFDHQELASCLFANESNLAELIRSVLSMRVDLLELDAIAWAQSRYKPTPTIVQAAQALYEGHDVSEISRSDAGVFNLTKTKSALAQIIDDARDNQRKAICFVTGVPGSGK